LYSETIPSGILLKSDNNFKVLRREGEELREGRGKKVIFLLRHKIRRRQRQNKEKFSF
jgi:hypothetical protein